MRKTKTYRSDPLAAVHETAAGLHRAGLMTKSTMREFDDLCLTTVQPLTPQQIKTIREEQSVSQTVFARFLNVTPGLVSKWERGDKHPAGTSLKLLTLVKKKGIAAIA